MSTKPIFLATHPRACSTAFERVFMTRRDILECAHEPFGDAFYYGPERLGQRYASDETARIKSGFSKTTYRAVLNRLEKDGSEGKRVFIKDMAYYLMAPDAEPTSIAPSLTSEKTNGNAEVADHAANGTTTNGTTDGVSNGHVNRVKRGVGTSEPGNPTVLPLDELKKYHFTFLIRHPRRGIPSFFRCTAPPLQSVTGFNEFMPNEAGYEELRRLFDYLREQNIIGPHLAEAARGDANGHANGVNGHTNGNTNGVNGHTNGTKNGQISITVIDADDLLDHPAEVVENFCKETGIDYTPKMLEWDNPEDQKFVEDAFAKWFGWHNDALKSKNLSPRTHAHKTVTVESEDQEWREKYGEEAQKVIRATVNENIPHYEYLKQFAIRV